MNESIGEMSPAKPVMNPMIMLIGMTGTIAILAGKETSDKLPILNNTKGRANIYIDEVMATISRNHFHGIQWKYGSILGERKMMAMVAMNESWKDAS